MDAVIPPVTTALTGPSAVSPGNRRWPTQVSISTNDSMSLKNLAHGLPTCLAVALLTVACARGTSSGSQTPPPSAPSTDVGFSAPLASACAALPAQTPLAEVKGSRLWALVFGPVPIKARIETKIVWRMGGPRRLQYRRQKDGWNGRSADLWTGASWWLDLVRSEHRRVGDRIYFPVGRLLAGPRLA
jgi:hypothetical protein